MWKRLTCVYDLVSLEVVDVVEGAPAFVTRVQLIFLLR